MIQLSNSYLESLPADFYQEINPTQVSKPEFICFNDSLANSLNIPNDQKDLNQLKTILSGNKVIAGSHPIAQAYAGHQFGHFTMLGDGRAILLGELDVNHGKYDLQLKGAGITKYSRRGDGRATLISMLREYLMSEAMHHLGVKTTRSLAVVKTGDPVYREYEHDGAVMTRIAQSHVRVGTFEYARSYTNELEKFTKYVVKRHYPELLSSENYALEFLRKVMHQQIDLVVDWMRVGFIHGVMNTDNMSIAGETIDYGPCAFMNAYHPATVFSSIDQNGRYAYGNQPYIAHWNLAILANALLPLIAEDEKIAIDQVEQLIQEFPNLYDDHYRKMMFAKLGIQYYDESDFYLIDDILNLLQKHQIDYTNFFKALETDSLDSKLTLDVEFLNWHTLWKNAHHRHGDQNGGLKLMSENNPVIIPRNHLVENALEEVQNGSLMAFEILIKQLCEPYKQQSEQVVPSQHDSTYQTFCGT